MINIYNGNTVRGEVRIHFKAVVLNPIDEPRGPASDLRFVDLRPEEGVELDCDDIRRLLGPNIDPSGFLKGFVQLSSGGEEDRRKASGS